KRRLSTPNKKAAKPATESHPVTVRRGRGSASQDATLKLWVVLARAYAAVAKHVEDDVARHGLTSAEFGILEALYHKGPLLLGEIQRKVLVSSGGITYLVDRLTAKGLVERQDCPNDRRARYAVLTDAGEKLIAEIFPRHAARITRAVSGLTAAEKTQATELLRKLGLAAADGFAAGAEGSSKDAA
ncbi:MAG TPA: MarR family transcriptional regulator, partial [Gemmatimonadaceae bacterium]|nr:MarR family transcriptional regulator [Gemmatimonadaceae bacterium]